MIKKNIKIIGVIFIIVMFSMVSISLAKYMTSKKLNFNLDILAKFNITFDPLGGEIPESSNNEWMVNEDGTATKVIQVGEKYGEFPVPTKKGCKFYGWNVVKLPGEYQMIEYLESTEKQYIKTSLSAQKDDIFITKSSTNATGIYKTIIGANGSFELFYNVPSAAPWSNMKILEGQTKGIELGKVYIHKSTIPNNVSTNASTVELFSYGGNYNLIGRIYDVQWIRDGEMYAHFVPCYRKEDKVAGMYDVINRKFYTNSGSGEFVLGNEIEYSSETEFTDAKDLKLIAMWEGNKYKANLDYGDENVQAVEMIFGEENWVDTPRKTGYTFDGYYTEKDGKGEKYFDSEGRATKEWDTEEEITLYANWIVNTYSMKFYSKETDTLIEEKTINYGENIGELPVPEKEGYTFEGWKYSRLPVEYQDIEYLESTGKQYIKTDLKVQKDDIFSTTSSPNETGVYKTIIAVNEYLELYYNVPNVQVWRGCLQITEGPTSGIQLNNKYSHKCKVTEDKNTLNGLEIFSYGGNYNLVGKIYDVEWFRGGVTYAHFIPCYRKSDNVAGMYDFIANKFYANSGTDEFTVGPNTDDNNETIESNTEYNYNFNMTLYAQWKEES